MKIITAEQIQMIIDANKRVAGTREYLKYHMEYHIKNENGRWKYYGNSYPAVNHDCPVKTVKGVMYIIERPNVRYEMTDAVLELLGWK